MRYDKGTFAVIPQIAKIEGKNPILQTAYMWICHFSNQEGYCFPSQVALAAKCGVSKNAIRRYILELEQMGLISRERRYKDGMEISSMYHVVVGVSPDDIRISPDDTGVSPDDTGVSPRDIGVYHHVGGGVSPDGNGTKYTGTKYINITSNEVILSEASEKTEKQKKKKIEKTDSPTDITTDNPEETKIETFGRKEINDLIAVIKETVGSLGFIYKPGSRERERAKNILTGKDFGEVCERSGMDRTEFAKNILVLTSKLEFWSGKIYNCETLYKHYAQVYNEAVKKKQEMQKRRRSIH